MKSPAGWADMPTPALLLSALTKLENPTGRQIAKWLGIPNDDHASRGRFGAWMRHLHAQHLIRRKPTTPRQRYPTWEATDTLRAATTIKEV